MRQSKGEQWREVVFIFVLPSKPREHWVLQPHSSESEILGFKSWFDFCFQPQPRRTRAGNHEVSKTIINVCEPGERNRNRATASSVQGVGKAEGSGWEEGWNSTCLRSSQHSEQEMRMGEFNSWKSKDLARRLGEWCGWENPSVSTSYPSLSPCFGLAPRDDVCLGQVTPLLVEQPESAKQEFETSNKQNKRICIFSEPPGTWRNNFSSWCSALSSRNIATALFGTLKCRNMMWHKE